MGGDPRLVGTTLAGRYQLVRLLGDGGMGAVYKAADQVLRRFVAIKMLHPAVAQRPAAVERFQREARAAAAIGHPNIIDILDFGVDGQPYMVMEYLRGRSLSQVISAETALAIPRACSIAAHALAGLAAAHERGILHRDLKPANLMLVQRFGDKSFVKVCDFGFAALMGPTSAEDGKTLTPARTLVGTPAYASPERLRGDDRRDPRVDIYSIGVVLYEMIVGRRPFDGETFRDLARAVKHDPPPRVSKLRRDVPTQLDDVIQRALAKSPEERFRNAGEFAAALVPFGGRNIALNDEPSDSFTFEVWQIRQRDSRKQGTRPSIELPPESARRSPPAQPAAVPAVPVDPFAPRRPSSPPLPRAQPATALPFGKPAGFAPQPFAPPPAAFPAPAPARPAPTVQPASPPFAPTPAAHQRGAFAAQPPAPLAPSAPMQPAVTQARTSFPSRVPTAPMRSMQPSSGSALPLAAPSLPLVPLAAPRISREGNQPAGELAWRVQNDPTVRMPTMPRHDPAHVFDFDDATTADRPPVGHNAPERMRFDVVDRDKTEVANPLLAPRAVPKFEAVERRRIGDSDHDQLTATTVSLLVRGKVLVAALRFVARRFGERSVKEVLDTLSPMLRRPFDEGVDAERWYPGEVLTGLAERIDAVHGRDDLHVVVELGRAVAESGFEEMRKLKPPAPPPELLLTELPTITRGLIQGAETALRRIGRGYARVELLEGTNASLTLAVLILGFVERSLGRFGATEVEVNLLSSRALDDKETMLDISWIAA